MNTTSETTLLRAAFGVRIAGTGSYVPENRVTNEDLSKKVETSDEWIFERTGIRARRMANSETATSDLALQASLQALESAGLKANDIDAILVATVTPDHFIPSTACLLQAKLGCRTIFALDISAACSGFIYGLKLAESLIQNGSYKNVLLVGAETLSRFMNFNDRQTCILFGDGAGAAILSRTDVENHSILYSDASAVGDIGGVLTIPAGGSRKPLTQQVLEESSQFIHMNGREVFRNAVSRLTSDSVQAMDVARVKPEDVDYALIHQANMRIIEKVGENLRIPAHKLLTNIEETGNTSSASIPILFDQNVKNGTIQRGHTLLLAAFGAGLTSGAAVVRF
ncbi:MAG: ketoacyl-ACP synthase III [Proteobacteria bacterium]|nr:MAG: ketoacyl-ACP synthase III [Pseudomonadota bacterium]